MTDKLSYEVLTKAWEEEVTEEVEAARQQTLACMNAGLYKLKAILKGQEGEKAELLICMQMEGLTKEERAFYEYELKKLEMLICYVEQLYDVVDGTMINYQRVWADAELSEEEQEEQAKWAHRTLRFLTETDEDFDYEAVSRLIREAC